MRSHDRLEALSAPAQFCRRSDGRIVIANDGEDFTEKPNALLIRPGVPRSHFQAEFKRRVEQERRSPWDVGDMLVYALREYGRAYVRSMKATGYSQSHFRNLRYVASRVAPERRRLDLSWTHHYHVAKLPPEEQAERLAHAAAEAWTAEELRRELRQRLAVAPAKFPSAERTGRRCPTCGREYE